MSGDPEQEYFTDGITEDIITELSRFHSLFVIARNSSFSYKGKSPDIRQVGRELGVRYVLEGSIRKSSNRIRVTGQLIDTLTGNHIWAERYDRVLEDIFAVQEEVTRAIVAAIAPQIEADGAIEGDSGADPTISAPTKSLFGRGPMRWREGTRRIERFSISRSARQRKRWRSTRSACWHCMRLLWLTANALFIQMAVDREHALREATWAVARAIELDGTDALGYALRGIVVLLSGQWDRYPDALADATPRSRDESQRCVCAAASRHFGSRSGSNTSARIEHGHQVLRLNPREPRNHMAYNLMAYASFGAKQYAEGIDWASRALNDMPRMICRHTTTLRFASSARERSTRQRLRSTAVQKLAPEYFRSRLEGTSSYARSEDRKRATTFLRIAAGLEDPSAADALR